MAVPTPPGLSPGQLAQWRKLLAATRGRRLTRFEYRELVMQAILNDFTATSVEGVANATDVRKFYSLVRKDPAARPTAERALATAYRAIYAGAVGPLDPVLAVALAGLPKSFQTLGPADLDLVAALRGGLVAGHEATTGLGSVASLYEVAGDAARGVSDTVRRGALGGASFEQIRKDVGVVLGQVSGEAHTVVNTHLHVANRVAILNKAQAVGVEKYEYVGPDDGRTRPFCREHEGQVKTLAEWAELSNGQGLPVPTCGGGYNCRHELRPASAAEEE